MNFIEASQIIKKHIGGKAVHIRLASSATVDPFILYLKAAAALQGQTATISTLPFGTLGQALLNPPDSSVQEIVILLPWDLVPESDWRSGIPENLPSPEILLDAASSTISRLMKRNSIVLYLDAPIPPLYLNLAYTAALHAGILQLIAPARVKLLDQKYFALGSYLSSGLPFASMHMGELATEIMAFAAKPPSGFSKVLITDLDNVMWSGLAAEDGPNGIQCGAEGKGFKHFIYQGFLAKLKANGILLAAVSRNDLDIACAPIHEGYTLLHRNDFVEILASYEPKSAHIKRLAQRLNLGMDSFVFVDDNPIELAEVNAALPMVKCIQFPVTDDQLISFLETISILFERSAVSAEDKERTEMYRRVLDVHPPSSDVGEGGGDLKEFLSGLKMELVIYNRSKGDRERAIQLINKTNQFNLNGRRITDEEAEKILQSGGKMYTVKLNDRTGTHGEILVCLINEKGQVVSFVLSCRIFQRQVEYAFICWLLQKHGGDLSFDYAFTERNTPLREFIKDTAFTDTSGNILLNGNAFLNEHADILNLFKTEEVGFD